MGEVQIKGNTVAGVASQQTMAADQAVLDANVGLADPLAEALLGDSMVASDPVTVASAQELGDVLGSEVATESASAGVGLGELGGTAATTKAGQEEEEDDEGPPGPSPDPSDQDDPSELPSSDRSTSAAAGSMLAAW